MSKGPFILFLLFGFILVSKDEFCFAQEEVPLYIKYRYEKQTGRKWYDASPERQQEYIDEIRRTKEIEKAKEALAESHKLNVKIQKEAIRERKKLKEEQRKQDSALRAAKRKIQVELRQAELELMKQRMSTKLDNMRSRQSSR